MDEDDTLNETESAIVINPIDVESTVAFSLIAEAEKANQVRFPVSYFSFLSYLLIANVR